jgi:hypothetical protein
MDPADVAWHRDRLAEIAQLRDGRRLTPDELRQAAEHFRALGQDHDAERAETMAAQREAAGEKAAAETPELDAPALAEPEIEPQRPRRLDDMTPEELAEVEQSAIADGDFRLARRARLTRQRVSSDLPVSVQVSRGLTILAGVVAVFWLLAWCGVGRSPHKVAPPAASAPLEEHPSPITDAATKADQPLPAPVREAADALKDFQAALKPDFDAQAAATAWTNFSKRYDDARARRGAAETGDAAALASAWQAVEAAVAEYQVGIDACNAKLGDKSGGTNLTDEAQINAVRRRYPGIAMTFTGDPMQPTSGHWTVSYESVARTAWAAAEPLLAKADALARF